MALDKVVDSKQLDADLNKVANAIRENGGTTDTLAFPDEFVTAIGNMSAGGSGCTLNVTGVAGDTVTITKDSITRTKTLDSSGMATFKGLEGGVWSITMTNGSQTVTNVITLKTDYSMAMTYSKIFGIMRDVTAESPEWTRTKGAVGLNATASVGTVAGSSDFDNIYPWSGIVRETLSTGDVMVKIPKFWYRRYRNGNIEYIEITGEATANFTLHPAFNHKMYFKSGIAVYYEAVETDYIYVGAYKTSSGNVSISGEFPLVSKSRAEMRNGAQKKGDGWWEIDFSTLSAIQMLILVEFANNDVQAAIGRGYCDGNSSALETGTCDGVPNLTGRPAGTDGKVDVVWRGIEGFWGNVMEWVDGFWGKKSLVTGTEDTYVELYYVCNTPKEYWNEDSNENVRLAYWKLDDNGYIKTLGLDKSNSYAMFPYEVGGSATTYICDYRWYSTKDDAALAHGGSWKSGSAGGLFMVYMDTYDTNAYTNIGSRLLYIPS